MSIETVSGSVEDNVGASQAAGTTKEGDDITNVSVWRTFWWNHSNKVIIAGFKFE